MIGAVKGSCTPYSTSNGSNIIALCTRISISGNIVAERGAVLDVSGTSGALDLHPTQLGLDYFGGLLMPGDRLVPFTSGVTGPLYAGRRAATRLDSAGGSISLRGAQMLFSDATLRGEAGGPSALGGTLSVASGRYVLPGGTSNSPLARGMSIDWRIAQANNPAGLAKERNRKSNPGTLVSPCWGCAATDANGSEPANSSPLSTAVRPPSRSPATRPRAGPQQAARPCSSAPTKREN